MNTKETKNIKKRLMVWAIIVTAILMIPFLAKAPWTESDFAFAGVVLFSLASVYELTTRNMKNKMHHIIVAMVLLFLIMLILAWAATGPPNEAANVITK